MPWHLTRRCCALPGPPGRRPAPPAPHRWVAGVGALLAAAAGCAPVEPPPPGWVDLLAPAHPPLTAGETGEVRPGDPELGEGFYPPEGTGEGRLVWAGEGPATVELQFASRRPRWIEIEGAPLSWPGAPPLVVELRLDGEPLGSFTAAPDGSTSALAIPRRLSAPGRHRLELRFSRADAPRDVLPGNGDRRRLSLQLRAVRVLPPAPAPAPEWAPGRLELGCGGRASWPRWIVRGSQLEAEIEADLGSRRGGEAGDRGGAAAGPLLTAETDGAAPRALAAGPLPSDLSGPVRLVLGCPPGASGRLTVRRLALVEPVAEPPAAPARPAGRAVLVVGRLAGGPLAATPCSSRPEPALGCLLSGVESAAFGYPAEPAMGWVGGTVEEVAGWLAAAEPPAVAALVAPDRPAGELFAELRALVPGVAAVLTELPAGRGDVAVGMAVPGSAGRPVGASHLDLVPTLYGLAGMPPPGSPLEGLDLGAALAADRPVEVRPVGFVWDPGRSAAVVGGRAFWLPAAGPGAGGAPPARSVREEVLARWTAARRSELEWLGRLPGAGGPPGPGGAATPQPAAAGAAVP